MFPSRTIMWARQVSSTKKLQNACDEGWRIDWLKQQVYAWTIFVIISLMKYLLFKFVIKTCFSYLTDFFPEI